MYDLSIDDLWDLYIRQIEVVNTIAIIGHKDESICIRECFAYLLEAAHIVQVLTVLARFVWYSL